MVHVKNQYFLKVRRYVQFNVCADHEWTKMNINEQPRKIKSCYPIEICKNWIDIQNMERSFGTLTLDIHTLLEKVVFQTVQID